MIATAEHSKPTLALDDDEFFVIEDVPVFREHINREGKMVGQEQLKATCDNCNERIEETGDYCPIVIRHTKEDGSADPKVIGFCGPYKMGKVGHKKPKHAILGRFNIFKKYANTDILKEYPRRSVEFWATEDDSTIGYFDPLALLGAETPELDLGIHYSKGRKGQRLVRYSKVERYEASFPGGSNTFVPSTGIASPTKPKVTRLDGKPLDAGDQYETSIKYGAGNVPLTSDDLQQLVIALTPVIQTTVNEAVRAATAEKPEIDPELDVPGGDAGLDAPGGDEPMPGLDGEDLDAPGGDPGLDAPGGDEELGGEGDDDLVDEVPDDEDDEDDEDDDDISAAPAVPPKKKSAKFSKASMESAPDHYSKMCEYADEAEADKYFAGLDDAGKQAVRASIDGDDNPDRKIRMRKKYMATAANNPANVPAPVADVTTSIPTATQYAKERKEHGELRTRYAKLHREHSELSVKYAKQEEELAGIRAEKKQAVRYQKLSELAAQGYCLDPHDEMEETDHLTDEQFDSHCTRVVTKYQRIPLGMIPVPKPLTYDGSTREAKSQKYAKQARENVLAARAKGENLEYAKELNRLIDADTTVGKTKETAGAT